MHKENKRAIIEHNEIVFLDAEKDGVKNMDATNKLAEYLAKNQISTTRVAADTGVPEEKLQPGNTLRLEAGEFLELCSYLDIKPEMFYQSEEKQE